MGVIKSFSDFVKETETSEATPSGMGVSTNPAMSESLCIKLKECMEMAMAECNEYHNDDNTEHKADGYLKEAEAWMDLFMEGMKSTCEGLMNTPDAPDGDMRQGNTQDMN